MHHHQHHAQCAQPLPTSPAEHVLRPEGSAACADVRGPALVHARFTFDRAPFKRMHQALLRAATLPLSMHLLPPLHLSDAGTATGGLSTAGIAAGFSNQPSLYRPQPETGRGSNAGSDLPSDELFKAALTAPAAQQVCALCRQLCNCSFVELSNQPIRVPSQCWQCKLLPFECHRDMGLW